MQEREERTEGGKQERFSGRQACAFRQRHIRGRRQAVQVVKSNAQVQAAVLETRTHGEAARHQTGSAGVEKSRKRQACLAGYKAGRQVKAGGRQAGTPVAGRQCRYPGKRQAQACA